MKYAYILERCEQYSVLSMCRLLKVSRSGYYDWPSRASSQRSIDNRRLLKLIRQSFEASGRIYGSPRIFCDLHELGETCGKNRVERLMRLNKIRAQRGYKKHDYKYTKPAVAVPNRLKQVFTVDKPDTSWVTDITYIRTYEGWLYLAVVMDLYSRKIIGCQ